MNPTLASYSGIPGYAILYLLFAVALGVFLYRLYYLGNFLRLGTKENRFDRIWDRIKQLIGIVLIQRCVLKSVSLKDIAGFGHFFIFWTFLIFLVNYAYLFIWGAWNEQGSLLELGNGFSTFYAYLMDIVAVITAIAVIWALVRRYVIKPDRLERGFDPVIILAMVFLLMITHITGEGLRIAMTPDASGGPISTAFSNVFNGSENTLQTPFYANWWFHMLILLEFMAYIIRD